MCESRNEIVSYSLLCRPLAIFRGKFMILTLWNSSLRYGTYVPYRIPFGLVYSYCVFIFFLSFSLVLSSFLLLLPVECFFFCIRFILPLREILSFGICISASLDPTHSHKRVNIEHIINFHVNAIYRHKRKRWKQKKYRTKKRFFARWFAVDERKRNTAPYSTIRLHRTNDSQPTILYAFTFRYWPKQDCFRHCV